MAQWEYCTLVYTGAHRRWFILPSSAEAQLRAVGESGKARFGGLWEALRRLETALKELDAEGWELVSTSFSGLFTLDGAAVLRRPISTDQDS